MGPDPFNMPGATSAGLEQGLQSFVNQAAPLAQVYHGPMTGPSINFQPMAPPAAKQPTGFWHWMGDAVHEVGNVASTAGHFLATTAEHFVTAVPRYATGIEHAVSDSLTSNQISHQNDQFTNQMNKLMGDYKAGNISKSQYTSGLNDLTSQFQNLSKQASALNAKAQLDKVHFEQATFDTVGDVVAVMTGGLSNIEINPFLARTVGFLGSDTAAASLDTVASSVGKLAVSDSIKELPDTVANLVQHSAAEVIGSGVSQTAAQTARSVAVNMLLKYPVASAIVSGTGEQILTDLQNRDYGGAVGQVAFNAALFLTGGLFGAAWKYAGKFMSGLGTRTFGQSAFWDEVSKMVYNDPAKIYTEANQTAEGLSETEKADFFKNMSAAEATNLHAAGGDAVGAASRMLQTMMTQRAVDTLDELSKTDFLGEAQNYFTHFRAVTEEAKAQGVGDVLLGRMDARDKSSIADFVTQAEDPASQSDLWEQWKTAHPNAAASVNKSIDTQIKNLIGKNLGNDALHKAISTIPASTEVKELVGGKATQAALKDGYIPIKTANPRAANFVEGTGKVSTAYSGENFWVKTVQPLPVLGWVGTALSNMGLSPYASTQRVYDMFNTFLADRLNNLGVSEKLAKLRGDAQTAEAAAKSAQATQAGFEGLSKDEIAMLQKQGVTPEMLSKGNIVGETAPKPNVPEVAKNFETTAQQSDFIIKVLSNYAHDMKFPATDLRELSAGNIVKAFRKVGITIDRGDAKEIQQAITDAHSDVPMAVEGLGDKAINTAYKIIPGQRQYMKLMTGLRFSFNPFFKFMRVIPKTEILSEAEGGGVVKSLFSGRWSQVGEIRNALADMGAFDRKGIASYGEAVEAGGEGANLGKKLLPMQERSIAGLIDAQAQRLGMSWQDYIKAEPQAVRDTTQMIAEYDKHSGFLNSPLMRTLNTAFFPLRFETKVASILGRNLAKSSMLTQVAFVKGTLGIHQWLNSPQGMAWYAQNSDVIGLFEYITPIASLNQVFESLVPGHDHTLGNFGQLGGLPFGWIPLALDAEGLTHFDQPGVNPKTGAIYSQYVPVTARGHIAIALQDFLMSVFSYPGATVGLPSKTSLARNFSLSAVGGSKAKDLRLSTPPVSSLSAQQQNYSQTIQGMGSTPVNQAIGQPQVPLNPAVRAPGMTPQSYAVGSRKTGSSSTKSAKKKKAQFTPELLPGQTQLGQI